jgi:hypothetical protein
MGSWLAVGLLLIVGAVALAAVLIRGVGHDPAVWHVDPAATTRSARPNDALAAPPGLTPSPPDIPLAFVDRPASDLLAAVDATARGEPRVAVVAGSLDEGRITYVQRSALFGFPDYISVSVVAGESGSGLVLWSRSRFGYSDLGVNRSRLERWLESAGLR